MAVGEEEENVWLKKDPVVPVDSFNRRIQSRLQNGT